MDIRTSISASAEADIFIIPNPLVCVTDFLGNEVERKLQVLAEFNAGNKLGIQNPNLEPLVQIWWSSSELCSENLCDHGAHIIGKNGERITLPTNFLQYVPVSIFKDAKESDVIDISITHSMSVLPPYTSSMISYHFKAKCSQLNYRYAGHGRFEEVLEKLKNQYADHSK